MSSDTSPAEPSWIKVISTTLRLWVRRRVLRVSDSAEVSSGRRAALTVAVLLVLAAAATVAVVGTRSDAGRAAAHGSATQAVNPAQIAAAANAQAAAAWIAAQVSRAAVIGCDQAMCADLDAAGFPSSQQVQLKAGAHLPGTATLLVDTGVLREDFGQQVPALAPAVIATFGGGTQVVELRAIVAGGAAAYARDERAALAARRSMGRALAADGRLRLQPVARGQLVAGLVDPRLIVLLHRLAASRPIDVARFNDGGKGQTAPGSAGPFGPVPLRTAVLAGVGIRRAAHQVSALTAILREVRAQRWPYRAAYSVTYSVRGRAIVRLQFSAPSPF